jgi:hypothetical protein
MNQLMLNESSWGSHGSGRRGRYLIGHVHDVIRADLVDARGEAGRASLRDMAQSSVLLSAGQITLVT